ncbi:MAG TPA: penicillin-binding protein 2 [Acidobacteriaceae bacterium]|nr:penicillin-binding protein 2 [Acidobacteriaceae bacterium]
METDALSGRNEKLPTGRLHAAQYILALVLTILLVGLWRLQVLNTDSFRVLAEANRIRKVPVLAPRGKIFDREGRLIVDNYPSVSCFLLREQNMQNVDADLPMIANGLHIPLDQLQATVKRYQHAPKYEPIPVKEDITPDEQAFIEAHRNELPELETLDEQRRLYPPGGFAAHLIGYVGEVSEEMLNDPEYAEYEPGDVVGRSGIEKTYDSILRGRNGSRDVVVDSHGREIGHLGETPAEPGHDLRLTIDLDLQKVAEQALQGHNGAIVAMDPHTGEILAMVSRPTFDPNAFSVRIKRDEWQQILDDPNHPLLNKAIQAQLAPGSTFKIIMSAAGLQENVAQGMHVFCNGGGTFYGHYFKCDARHGMVDIDHAIPWSCDTYFYTLAQRLGIETIAKYAGEFGIGEKTGIDLPEEATGTMPSEEWKLRNYHEKWYAGETISVGIGQGAIAVTPIQLARALSGIASGGVMRRPHLVFPDEIPDDQKDEYEQMFPGSGDKTVPLDPANWETITDGMAAATLPGGTASASHLEGIDFAGKTGTAQTISHDEATKLGLHGSQTNAWFVGMTPRRNPDIVVVALWEGGTWGADSAHLVAAVVNAYVTKQRRLAGNLVAETPKPAAAPAASDAKPVVPQGVAKPQTGPQGTAKLQGTAQNTAGTL